jgi:hypothetical protein
VPPPLPKCFDHSNARQLTLRKTLHRPGKEPLLHNKRIRSSMAEEGFKLPGLGRPPTKGLGKGQRTRSFHRNRNTPSCTGLDPLPRSIHIQTHALSPTRLACSPVSVTTYHQTTASTKGICLTLPGKAASSYLPDLSWMINPSGSARLRRSLISNSLYWTNTRR